MLNDVVLMFDNARIHVTKTVKEKLQSCNMMAFTNCPYTPELNPAEAFIRIHKNIIKRELGQLR